MGLDVLEARRKGQKPQSNPNNRILIQNTIKMHVFQIATYIIFCYCCLRFLLHE